MKVIYSNFVIPCSIFVILFPTIRLVAEALPFAFENLRQRYKICYIVLCWWLRLSKPPSQTLIVILNLFQNLLRSRPTCSPVNTTPFTPNQTLLPSSTSGNGMKILHIDCIMVAEALEATIPNPHCHSELVSESPTQ